MTQSTNPADLEAIIADETAAIEACRARRGEALAAGRIDEADDWSREIAQRRARIEGLEDALRPEREAQADAATAEEVKQAQKDRARLQNLARKVRKLAAAEDEALSAVVAARRALLEGIAELWLAADGPTQSRELGDLPTTKNNLPLIALERLAHGDVMASRSPMLDRSAPAPSVREHLDKVLDLIAPGPGRPPKAGGEDAQKEAA